MTDITESKILEVLNNVSDPVLGRSLGELGMLKSATHSDDAWTIGIELPTPAYPNPDRITAAIQDRLVAQLPETGEVHVEFTSNIKGKNAGGAIGLKVKNVIAVGSGKGGVGKSTVATSLAYGLKNLGAAVGLMDADVYGPSVPHLVGAKGEPAMEERQNTDGTMIQRLQPVMADGIPMMSIGFIVKEDQAVIWRGPMLHKLLTQFLQQTDWGELDYLIIDMPPGTGDVAITISQMVGLSGAVVVCTPQKVALLDAVKAISMFRQVKIPVLGIVENMSGEVFGRGGAKAKAEELNVPFLGEIPIDAAVREHGDAGAMSALLNEENEVREPILHVCQNVAMEIARSLMDAPKMPSLDIL